MKEQSAILNYALKRPAASRRIPETMFLGMFKELVGDKRVLDILKVGFDMIASLKSLTNSKSYTYTIHCYLYIFLWMRLFHILVEVYRKFC